MHESVKAFVSSYVAKHDIQAGTVLDVGSYDVNGNLRSLFVGPYTGIDMREGPNVDFVLDAHDIPKAFDPQSFDVVLCCEMLEHDTAFWLTMPALGGILKRGGHLIFTTRGLGFPLHEYPHDLWRFTPAAGQILLDLAGCDGEVFEDTQAPGIFGSGRKN